MINLPRSRRDHPINSLSQITVITLQNSRLLLLRTGERENQSLGLSTGGIPFLINLFNVIAYSKQISSVTSSMRYHRLRSIEYPAGDTSQFLCWLREPTRLSLGSSLSLWLSSRRWRRRRFLPPWNCIGPGIWRRCWLVGRGCWGGMGIWDWSSVLKSLLLWIPNIVGSCLIFSRQFRTNHEHVKRKKQRKWKGSSFLVWI